MDKDILDKLKTLYFITSWSLFLICFSFLYSLLYFVITNDLQANIINVITVMFLAVQFFMFLTLFLLSYLTSHSLEYLYDKLKKFNEKSKLLNTNIDDYLSSNL